MQTVAQRKQELAEAVEAERVAAAQLAQARDEARPKLDALNAALDDAAPQGE